MLEQINNDSVYMSKYSYDQRHGGPFDRGSCDSYYRREFDPHFYVGDTYKTERVELKDMSPEDVVAYTAGFNFNERYGDFKDWGEE